MLEPAGGTARDCLGTRFVAEMPTGTTHAQFKMPRISAVEQHLLIMICLYHKLVRLADISFYIRSNMPHISYKTESRAAINNLIANIVTAVVGNIKRSYGE